jgi:hypothetical protein
MDLALSGKHLFSELKNVLKGKIFLNIPEIMQRVTKEMDALSNEDISRALTKDTND